MMAFEKGQTLIHGFNSGLIDIKLASATEIS